jgi:2-methylcitrate dehydratase PrpD
MTAGRFSAPYVLTTYLYQGSDELDYFTPGVLADETVRGAATRVELSEDDRYEAAFPELWGVSVIVELRDGTPLRGARGNYRVSMPDGEYRAQNCVLLAYGLGAGRNGDDDQVNKSLTALDAISERPVRSTVGALRS